MQMPDVNVLVYAHRTEAPEHEAYALVLERLVSGPAPFAVSEGVLVGFLRVVTHRKAFRMPTPIGVAIAFVEELVRQPTCRVVRSGPRHLALCLELCRKAGATGPLVADAVHAAVAIEHGCEWLTADADFARFADLRWRHPLA